MVTGGVAVFLFRCGGVCVVVFLFWCGGVFALVFLWWWWRWWCSCGGVFVVVQWCFCGVFVFLWWCFCMFFFVKGRLSSHYREVMHRVLTTLV